MSALTPPWSRLVRFQAPDSPDILFGDIVIPPASEDPHQPSQSDAVDVGLAPPGTLHAAVISGDPLDPAACSVTSTVKPVARLLGPLTPAMVPSVRCIGLNYLKHIKEGGRPVPPLPSMFLKTPRTVNDHSGVVVVPKIAQDDQADYEGELVVVMARDAKDVKEEDALGYVLGYCAGNDVSSRKWQRDPKLAGGVPQWSFSKSFDGYAPLGPCITSAKLIPNPQTLTIRTSVNNADVPLQNSNTSDMLFPVARIIAFLSQGTTLEAGSIIMTGTPEGVGYAIRPENGGPRFLRHGDRVEIFVQGVGTLWHGVEYAGADADADAS